MAIPCPFTAYCFLGGRREIVKLSVIIITRNFIQTCANADPIKVTSLRIVNITYQAMGLEI